MRNLRSEQEIAANWKGESIKPVVSICCVTYNHEFYIEDALEGFLIQKTNFPFELLIHDDASTDKTADIIREYETKYQNIFKPIYQVENQYSQGKKPNSFNFPRAKGKYIAVCEGDDYWTDPYKLQKQIDFLEANPEYVISGHDAFIIDESGNKIQDSKLPEKHKKNFSSEDLVLGKAWILTMSWVFRNVLTHIPPVPEDRMILNGDTFFTSRIGHFGKSKYHFDIKPACYRQHQKGIWSLKSEEDKSLDSINTCFWIYRYYKRIGDHVCAEAFWNHYSIRIIRRIETKKMDCPIETKKMIRRIETKKLFREIIIKCFALRKVKKHFFSRFRSKLKER